MKYLLSEEELQGMKDEIQEAKELHKDLQKQARSQGIRIRAIEKHCTKIVRGWVVPCTEAGMAEEIIDIINSRLEKVLVMLDLPKEEGD